MGNSATGISPNENLHSSPEKRNQNNEGFSQRQRQAFRKRYQIYDPRENQGIPVKVLLAIPEFAGNKLITILIHDYLNPQTGRMHLSEFLSFCTFLSSNTRAIDKKKALFESFNVYNTTTFTHDEIYRIYKTLLNHVISDDHILALTFEALRHPSLQTPGKITKEEFVRLIPDAEINEKLTVQFNVPSA